MHNYILEKKKQHLTVFVFFLLFQSDEYKYNRPQFIQKAKEWTQKYATGQVVTAASVKVLIYET